MLKCCVSRKLFSLRYILISVYTVIDLKKMRQFLNCPNFHKFIYLFIYHAKGRSST